MNLKEKLETRAIIQMLDNEIISRKSQSITWKILTSDAKYIGRVLSSKFRLRQITDNFFNSSGKIETLSEFLRFFL